MKSPIVIYRVLSLPGVCGATTIVGMVNRAADYIELSLATSRRNCHPAIWLNAQKNPDFHKLFCREKDA
jgi:hypothetical protein